MSEQIELRENWPMLYQAKGSVLLHISTHVATRAGKHAGYRTLCGKIIAHGGSPHRSLASIKGIQLCPKCGTKEDFERTEIQHAENIKARSDKWRAEDDAKREEEARVSGAGLAHFAETFLSTADVVDSSPWQIVVALGGRKYTIAPSKE